MKAKANRRQFGKDEILRILGEADNAKGTGRVVEVLRREGIYRSHLSGWQIKRAAGGYGPDKIPAGFKDEKAKKSMQVQTLQKQIVSLEKKLLHARTIIGIQKKGASLMGFPLKKRSEFRNRLISVVKASGDCLNIRQACGDLSVCRATFYRHGKAKERFCGPHKPKTVPRALSPQERETVRATFVH